MRTRARIRRTPPSCRSAFVALGGYFLDGIKGTYVIRQSGARAWRCSSYAASYFSDSNAQYNLARLYLEGTGVKKDPRHAARWFNLAAEKGHHRFPGAPRPSAHDRRRAFRASAPRA